MWMPKMPCPSGGPIDGFFDERTQTCVILGNAGRTVGRPSPCSPPSGEGTGAVSLRAAASGSAGRCLSCDDRRIVSYGCAAAIDCAAGDGCIAPTGAGGFYVAVIRRGRVLFLCGGRHRDRPGDASRVTIAESYRTGVPLGPSALRATDASPLRARGWNGRGYWQGTGADALLG